MSFSRPPSLRLWPSAPARFVRDVCVSVTAAAIGTLVFSGVIRRAEAPPPRFESKLADRLSFVQEDVPVRETRIFDTMAMFALPRAEPSAWSEVPAPPLRVAALPLAARPDATRTDAVRAVPRMAAADGHGPQRAEILPPARPAADLQPPARTALAETRPAPPPARLSAGPGREPMRVFGWSVPGTQVLPTSGDAVRAAALIGDTAARVGHGTADVVGGTAASVGTGLSSLGEQVADTIGWR